MLSGALDSLAAHFHEWGRKGGVEMAVPACRTIADQLSALAQDARALEVAQIPAGYRLPADPTGKVVLLADFRTAPMLPAAAPLGGAA